MSVDLELTPKVKRPAGQTCSEPLVHPDVERDHAARLAAVAKALGDPIRVQLVDVLRKHAGKVCVCELIPLFDVGQPTVSHRLRVLRDAATESSCCSQTERAVCCEPTDKQDCCGAKSRGQGCGCR